MHELGVVFHVIESVENIGKENQLTKVASVTLEVGEVSGVVPSYLTDCWKFKPSDQPRALRKGQYPLIRYILQYHRQSEGLPPKG